MKCYKCDGMGTMNHVVCPACLGMGTGTKLSPATCNLIPIPIDSWIPISSEFEACPICGYRVHIENPHSHTRTDLMHQRAFNLDEAISIALFDAFACDTMATWWLEITDARLESLQPKIDPTKRLPIIPNFDCQATLTFIGTVRSFCITPPISKPPRGQEVIPDFESLHNVLVRFEGATIEAKYAERRKMEAENQICIKFVECRIDVQASP